MQNGALVRFNPVPQTAKNDTLIHVSNPVTREVTPKPESITKADGALVRFNPVHQTAKNDTLVHESNPITREVNLITGNITKAEWRIS